MCKSQSNKDVVGQFSDKPFCLPRFGHLQLASLMGMTYWRTAIVLLAAGGALQAQFSLGCRPRVGENCGADMKQVNAALVSAESAWKFITSPQSGYFERMIVGQRMVGLMNAAWIPELLRARRELQKEQALNRFGVALSPLDSRRMPWPKDAPPPLAGTKRTILGREFVVPEKWIDAPETDEQWMRAPWPAQVAGIVGGVYGLPAQLAEEVARYSDPAKVQAIALTLPCEDYYSAQDLTDVALIAVSRTHTASPALFGTWLNAMHNTQGEPLPQVERATLGIMGQAARALSPSAADESWAMLQVLGLEELGSNYYGHADQVFRDIHLLHPVPYTLVLAAGRYLVAYKSYPAYQSQLAYSMNVLLEGAGEQPFERPESLFVEHSHTQADYDALVDAFRKWFALHEAGLRDKADKETALIEQARGKIVGLGGCRQ